MALGPCYVARCCKEVCLPYIYIHIMYNIYLCVYIYIYSGTKTGPYTILDHQSLEVNWHVGLHRTKSEANQPSSRVYRAKLAWYGGFHSHGDIPKWMVYFMKNPVMIWGYPYFRKPPYVAWLSPLMTWTKAGKWCFRSLQQPNTLMKKLQHVDWKIVFLYFSIGNGQFGDSISTFSDGYDGYVQQTTMYVL